MCLEGMLVTRHIADGFANLRSDLWRSLGAGEPRRPVCRITKVTLGHEAQAQSTKLRAKLEKPVLPVIPRAPNDRLSRLGEGEVQPANERPEVLGRDLGGIVRERGGGS